MRGDDTTWIIVNHAPFRIFLIHVVGKGGAGAGCIYIHIYIYIHTGIYIYISLCIYMLNIHFMRQCKGFL